MKIRITIELRPETNDLADSDLTSRSLIGVPELDGQTIFDSLVRLNTEALELARKKS